MKIFKRPRLRRGFTLMELLVTTLVVVMLALTVSVMITSGTNVYGNSVFVSESDSLISTVDAALSDILRFATDPHSDAGGVYFTRSSQYYQIEDGTIMLNDDGYLVYTAGPEDSEGLLLLNRGAYTDLRLDDDFFEFFYEDGVFKVIYVVESTKSSRLYSPVHTAYFRCLDPDVN